MPMSRLIYPASVAGEGMAKGALAKELPGAPPGGVMLTGALDIRVYPDPILRKRCEPLSPGGVAKQSVIEALKATWRPGMAGLAAPQIGLLFRAIAVYDGDGYRIFVNPVIVERSENVVRGPEACLSVPFVVAEVDRASWVIFEATDPNVGKVKLMATDHQAVAIQHEIDHLDGILFIDHLSSRERRNALNDAKIMQREAVKKPLIEAVMS